MHFNVTQFHTKVVCISEAMSLNVTLTQRFKPLAFVIKLKDWILPRLLHIEALLSYLSCESAIGRSIYSVFEEKGIVRQQQKANQI
jgi:hypothetical protein